MVRDPGTTAVLRMHVYDPEEGGREPGTVSGIVFSHHNPVAACAEISRRGGKVTDPPHEIHPPGFTVTLAVIADPDGNEFVLRSPRPQRSSRVPHFAPCWVQGSLHRVQ